MCCHFGLRDCVQHGDFFRGPTANDSDSTKRITDFFISAVHDSGVTLSGTGSKCWHFQEWTQEGPDILRSLFSNGKNSAGDSRSRTRSQQQGKSSDWVKDAGGRTRCRHRPLSSKSSQISFSLRVDIFVSIFYTYDTSFLSRDICILLHLISFASVTRLKLPQLACCESSEQLQSLYWRAGRRNSGECQLTQTSAFSHKAPLCNFGRLSGVQCTSESRFRHMQSAPTQVDTKKK